MRTLNTRRSRCMAAIFAAVTTLFMANANVRAADPPLPPVKAGFDGWLVLYVIPPPSGLNWSTPDKLLKSWVGSELEGMRQVWNGDVVKAHGMGHVHVYMKCSTVGFALTGMTSDEQSIGQMGDGGGILLRKYEGRMDRHRTSEGKNGAAEAEADIARRRLKPAAKRLLTEYRFPLRKDECDHLRKYYLGYIAAVGWKQYGMTPRPRGSVFNGTPYEGGGCGTFGVSFLEIAGITTRQWNWWNWSRNRHIGKGKISNVGSGVVNADPYPFYSNLVAALRVAGKWWTFAWPKAPVPASLRPVVSLGSWYARGDLPKANVVPFVVFDPELMDNVVRKIHAAGGNAHWIAATDGTAPVLEMIRNPNRPSRLKARLDPATGQVDPNKWMLDPNRWIWMPE